MTNPKLHHYSPVFANKPWSGKQGYVCFYRDSFEKRVKQSQKGKKQWGRQRKLYKTNVEISLGNDLETHVADVYKNLVDTNQIEPDAKTKWAQFLRSQFVRTPTFMRYEKTGRIIAGIENSPEHDRVGCEECMDLNLVISRDWVVLNAHKDDFFIRTDNPVHFTGFLSQPDSALYYPISPKKCFVACSMSEPWDPFNKDVILQKQLFQKDLQKGAANIINFYLAKAADESAIVHPENNGDIIFEMLTQVLGAFPQVPYDLHLPRSYETEKAIENLQKIMSLTDGIEYPLIETNEISTFYKVNTQCH